MKLSKQTLQVLQLMASLNPNIIINEGSEIRTRDEDNTVQLEFHSEETFDGKLSIYNLSEFLGVIKAFDDPEITIGDTTCVISQGRAKIQYHLADASLLLVPKRAIKLPSNDVTLNLTSEQVTKILKMVGLIGATHVSFVATGGKVSVIVEDKAAKEERRKSNTFTIELEDEVPCDFVCDFRETNLQLVPNHSYTVTLCKSPMVSKWKADSLDFAAYILMEQTSEFA